METLEDMSEVESPRAEPSVQPRGCRRTAAERSNMGDETDLPPKPKKRYAKRSEVWQHFVEMKNKKGYASCRYCGAEIGCDTKSNGTSSMKNHILRCKMFKDHNEREKQKVISSDKGNMKVVKYDPLMFRRSVVEMVVVNELPFSFVESEGWKRFCFNVLPFYQTFSRRTCCTDIVSLYNLEKAALKQMFVSKKQRVSLTTDIWVSPTTSCNYMVITGHWIDVNWKMQKRILGFKVVTDHRAETIQGLLIECCEEWGINRVFTVTVDNAKANDKAVRLFVEYMKVVGPETVVLDGEYVHMRCCAHILNLIVGDGLRNSMPSVAAIRNAVKYARSSYNRLKSFTMRCETAKVARGSLPLDVTTRWNSTYLMLTAALKVKLPFEKMRLEDKLYCEYFLEEDEKTKTKRVGPPTKPDWDEVARLVKFLKIFYKATVTFSASTSVTSTLCYNEIVNIEKNLITKCGNKDAYIRKQAHTMRDKFEKYWDGLLNMNPLVIIGSVFDPRNKMQFAALCIEDLYGRDTVESRKLHNLVNGVLKNLYEEYSIRLKKSEQCLRSDTTSATKSDHFVSQNMFSHDEDDDYQGTDVIYNRMNNMRTNQEGWSELDIYLSEKTEIRAENPLGLQYDVLSWWRVNSTRFPILSELARDVLAIQVSSVASESAFSTSGRILDPYRSSLTSHMVEVLLCTQQWLKSNYKSQVEVSNITQMLEDFEFLDSLDTRETLTTNASAT